MLVFCSQCCVTSSLWKFSSRRSFNGSFTAFNIVVLWTPSNTLLSYFFGVSFFFFLWFRMSCLSFHVASEWMPFVIYTDQAKFKVVPTVRELTLVLPLPKNSHIISVTQWLGLKTCLVLFFFHQNLFSSKHTKIRYDYSFSSKHT